MLGFVLAITLGMFTLSDRFVARRAVLRISVPDTPKGTEFTIKINPPSASEPLADNGPEHNWVGSVTMPLPPLRFALHNDGNKPIPIDGAWLRQFGAHADALVPFVLDSATNAGPLEPGGSQFYSIALDRVASEDSKPTAVLVFSRGELVLRKEAKDLWPHHPAVNRPGSPLGQ